MKNLIIMNNIKCNTACPILLQQFNSCPIKEKIDLFEICMILLSLSPYISIMINLFTLVKYRTTRSLSLFGMFIVQDIFRDPRPNYNCTKQFGNPANHSTFFSSLIIWFALEYIYLESKYRINKVYIFLIIIITPFVLIARIYLLYQNKIQIITGLILGVFVSIIWFYFFNNILLNGNNNVKRIMKKYKLNNNLSSERFDEFDIDSLPSNSILRTYLELQNKEKELKKLKNDLINYTSAIKNLDIVKNAKNNFPKEEGKNFNENEESDKEHKSQKID